MNQKSSEEMLTVLYKKDPSLCADQELYTGLLLLVKGMAREHVAAGGKKKLYYIFAEFLIGKFLSNNLINLGIYDNVKDIPVKHGKSLSHMGDMEPEPSSGNGGLGCLTACFLDSIVTFGLNEDGIKLDCHFGPSRQLFCSNLRDEEPSPWVESAPWLTKINVTYQVPYEGFTLTSRMYDTQVAGYRDGTSTLHLFDVETVNESLVTEGISFGKANVEKNLILFLYPDDSDRAGQVLRTCQQYFTVSNAARLILAEAPKKDSIPYDLPDCVVIQINDTHPATAIPELICLLTLEYGMEIDDVTQMVSRVCVYTNHAIPAEALETWPIEYFEDTVPQLVPIMEILGDRVRRKFNDQSVAVIDRGDRVHMAHIDIHYGSSVSDVAAFHTDVLEENELHNFYKMYPGKFSNKTNGITFHRWLLHYNPQLSASISGLIGEGSKKDTIEFQNLDDPAFASNIKTLYRPLSIKNNKKEDLAVYLEGTQGLDVNPQSISDVQIKRLHKYKRQQTNALYLIHKCLKIKQGRKPTTPVTAIFGAKAAPAYATAKDIIHMILCLQQIIDNDPDVKLYLQVVMANSYNVILAEKLAPAYNIPEQISLASKETSDTGNMKFILNGAVTLSTDNGTDVEIHQLVGDDDIYIFGNSSQTVIDRYKDGGYCFRDYCESNPIIREAVNFIAGPAMLTVGYKENLARLSNKLLNRDWFMTLSDSGAYCRTKEQAYSDYENRTQWAKKMLVSISQAGFFSSDRMILEYNRGVWKLDEEQHTAGRVTVIDLP